jgi:hypothetical protein
VVVGYTHPYINTITVTIPLFSSYYIPQITSQQIKLYLIIPFSLTHQILQKLSSKEVSLSKCQATPTPPPLPHPPPPQTETTTAITMSPNPTTKP